MISIVCPFKATTASIFTLEADDGRWWDDWALYSPGFSVSSVILQVG